MRKLTYARLCGLIHMDSLDLGSTPHDEPCTQVDPNRDYAHWQIVEAEVYARQLCRRYGNPPGGAEFFITQNPHDFGTYYELGILFNPEDPIASDYAFQVEQGCDHWDDEARRELIELEHPLHTAVVKPIRRAS